MATTIKGPAIFLAQFAGDKAPFDNLDNICRWAAGLGYKGVQIPTWVSSFIDLEKAANSKAYADEIKGVVNSHGLEITELSTHLQGRSWPCTRPTIPCSTVSRLSKCMAIRPRVRPGRSRN